jgi:heme-degrading monooxygenase HmoA
MIFRIASLTVSDADLPTLAGTYAQRCSPLIRAEPGNVDRYLLAPLEPGGQVLACTVWDTDQAARQYDVSGRGVAIAQVLRPLLGSPPTLLSYRRL